MENHSLLPRGRYLFARQKLTAHLVAAGKVADGAILSSVALCALAGLDHSTGPTRSATEQIARHRVLRWGMAQRPLGATLRRLPVGWAKRPRPRKARPVVPVLRDGFRFDVVPNPGDAVQSRLLEARTFAVRGVVVRVKRRRVLVP